MSEAFIVSAVRAASGRRNGRLSGWHPVDLGAKMLDAVVADAGADPAVIEDVIIGCVGQAGEQALNVARNAVLASRLPESVPGTSVDRQCGSSQQAIHFAAQAVMSGTMDVVIAAGVESMSRVPMGTATDLVEKNGFGSYMSPALDSRYAGERFSQFMGAEMLAAKYKLTRDLLDEYAYQSHCRAAAASRAGEFRNEIIPLQAMSRDAGALDGMHDADEGIRFNASLEAISQVKGLTETGVTTAANASPITDGAAAIMIVSRAGLKKLGVEPLARIHHLGLYAHDPVIMLDAPIHGTLRSLGKIGLDVDDIDLFEVNEAFACVPLAWLQATGADPARVNARGGAIALGHPLGASGARLMTTLVHALGQSGKRYGLQTMCEFGGMANVTVIERL
ncbi:acetyl-CoA C-acetyltransferase [Bordetella sp. BOR01]|uniref:acetyl-CoA C-acetyltransferase n=1 Tax=Bordetella sp. BOR01 TaxID=2854779 RepID=UPI001C4744E6|nr:acetyl-CoA C-acetyltransferase [Bordetella sp. BOR01]MBV7481695.1 acetyl-CoA C-acetyltransferase [Bordetella sp. BOR01]